MSVYACAQRWVQNKIALFERNGKTNYDVSLKYAVYVAGVVSNAIARFGYKEPNLSIVTMFWGLEKFGISKSDILNSAEEKAAIIRIERG
jgi:hypothetical protein